MTIKPIITPPRPLVAGELLCEQSFVDRGYCQSCNRHLNEASPRHSPATGGVFCEAHCPACLKLNQEGNTKKCQTK